MPSYAFEELIMKF